MSIYQSSCTYTVTRYSVVELTSEEVTAKRRAERRQFKLDRAAAIAAAAAEAEAVFATEGRVIVPALSGPAIPSAATWRPAPALEPLPPSLPDDDEEPLELEPLQDVEHLQLTLQEAFFLVWNLDCLTILDPDTVLSIFSNSRPSAINFSYARAMP